MTATTLPTPEAIKQHIVDQVTAANGMKLIDLVVKLEPVYFQAGFNIAMIDALVQEGRLVELCYAIPDHSHRLKSFLLPGQTHVALRGHYFPLTHEE